MDRECAVPLEHLWAAWRSAYVGQVVDTRTLPTPEEADGRSLFERILAGADEEGDEAAGVLWRGEHCFALLNPYPYTAGPPDGAARSGRWPSSRTSPPTSTPSCGPAVRDAVRRAQGARYSLRRRERRREPRARRPAARSPDHLHVHCVPRWAGDANFIAVAAETRVLPDQPRRGRRDRIRAAWPALRRRAGTVDGRDGRRHHDGTRTSPTPCPRTSTPPSTSAPTSSRTTTGAGSPATSTWCSARRASPAWAVAGTGRRARQRRVPRSPGSCSCSSAPTTWWPGWNLDVDERDALVAATRQVGFAVGHASAQLGWRGLRSRPTWRILLYSAEEPPQKRGPRAGRRRRRRDRRPLRRGQPRGLVATSSPTTPPARSRDSSRGRGLARMACTDACRRRPAPRSSRGHPAATARSVDSAAAAAVAPTGRRRTAVRTTDRHRHRGLRRRLVRHRPARLRHEPPRRAVPHLLGRPGVRRPPGRGGDRARRHEARRPHAPRRDRGPWRPARHPRRARRRRPRARHRDHGGGPRGGRGPRRRAGRHR